MKKHRLLPVLAAALVLVAPTESQDTTGLVAFGDSLSDNGNLFRGTGFPGPPYWQGRFSNGPVWVERMAEQLEIPPARFVDLAVGGATSGDVLAYQVLPFLTTVGDVPDDTLVTYWAGANDLLDLLDDPNQDPNELIEEATTNIGVALALLLLNGAEDIVVLNLPDLSLTPGVTSLNDPNVVLLAHAISRAFNRELGFVIDQLEAYFQVDLVEVDSFRLLTGIVQDPGALGFINVTDAAYDRSTGNVAPQDELYLFWDEIHPTGRAHKVLAGAVLFGLGCL